LRSNKTQVTNQILFLPFYALMTWYTVSIASLTIVKLQEAAFCFCFWCPLCVGMDKSMY